MSGLDLATMTSADPRELAFSMIRFYGTASAFTLAERYAIRSTAIGDPHGHGKWANAAKVIRELIETEQRLNNPLTLRAKSVAMRAPPSECRCEG